MNKAKDYAEFYKASLLEDVIPFWENNSLDSEHGAYFTSLDQDGTVYDKDKFMWPQCRQIWMFSYLYEKVEAKESWLDVASHGIKFIEKYGRDDSGNFYFSLDQKGNALTKAHNIFSDCFATLAFYQYGKITKNESYIKIGLDSFQNFLSRTKDPKGAFNKSTGYRKLKAFGLPMMTAYLTTMLTDSVAPEFKIKVHDDCIKQICEQHYDEKNGVIREYVDSEGNFHDSYEGRLINPGHGIEAMWFLMDIAQERNDEALFSWATKVCLEILEYSWDQEHGGIYYFMDCVGAPPQQLEWDQKLWWVHNEALIALSKAYAHQQNPIVWNWYKKVHQYSFEKFPDPVHGEWYGYLNRQGHPYLSLKGNKWKGCYHLPRALYECWQNFDSMGNLDLD